MIVGVTRRCSPARVYLIAFQPPAVRGLLVPAAAGRRRRCRICASSRRASRRPTPRSSSSRRRRPTSARRRRSEMLDGVTQLRAGARRARRRRRARGARVLQGAPPSVRPARGSREGRATRCEHRIDAGEARRESAVHRSRRSQRPRTRGADKQQLDDLRAKTRDAEGQARSPDQRQRRRQDRDDPGPHRVPRDRRRARRAAARAARARRATQVIAAHPGVRSASPAARSPRSSEHDAISKGIVLSSLVTDAARRARARAVLPQRDAARPARRHDRRSRPRRRSAPRRSRSVTSTRRPRSSARSSPATASTTASC